MIDNRVMKRYCNQVSDLLWVDKKIALVA
jgi:hypothetical protein